MTQQDKKKILVSTSYDDDLTGYDRVLAASHLLKKHHSASGRSIENILDVSLSSSLDKEVLGKIEKFLERKRQQYRWAPLAIQQLHWPFARYYQFKLRLKKLLEADALSKVVLASKHDYDLKLALTALCSEMNLELEIKNNRQDGPSSVLSLMVPCDIPFPGTLDPHIISAIVALALRIRGKKTSYQPYSNLQLKSTETFLTFSRISGFMSRILQEVKIRLGVLKREVPPPLINKIDYVEFLQREESQDWDRFDLTVLNTRLEEFKAKYPDWWLEKLYQRTRAFLRLSHIKEIFTIHDMLSSSRFFCFVAKSLGIPVNYVPHGIVFEDLSTSTKGQFSPSSIVAWNAPSKRRYDGLGLSSVNMPHPMHKKEYENFKSLPMDFSSARVLVLAPDWVGLSFGSRPDCAEKDLDDVLSVLKDLNVNKVDVKFHPTNCQEILNAQKFAIDGLRNMGFQFNLIKDKKTTRSLFDSYDLVITGPTTGFIEALRSSTPAIAFNSMIERFGVFDSFCVPNADNKKQLKEIILSRKKVFFEKKGGFLDSLTT